MKERRAHERFREANRVAVTVLEAQAAPDLVNRTFFCPTEDLSLMGLRLCVHQEVPIGSRLELRIAFTRPIRSFIRRGRVVWLRHIDGRYPHALGIEFMGVDVSADRSWGAIIERKLELLKGSEGADAEQDD